LLRFKVFQFHLGGRHYLLLPKLNSIQMRAFARRFETKGYSINIGEAITARSGESIVHVLPAGFCWSSSDPSDAVLPAIPDILSFPKEASPLRKIESKFWKMASAKGDAVVRLTRRIEAYSLWDKLRASDQCGLSPDEHAVARFMMGRANRNCSVLTDYPTDVSVPKILGRRRFFDSSLSPGEAIATLRVAGGRDTRNSYLKRDGVMALGSITPPNRDDVLGLIEDLGEWCYFVPDQRESSNC